MECKPAAQGIAITSSCEKIISEFQSQGRPSNPANVVEGSILGGFEIKTPKVGDGFIEWAIKGYDLEGKAPAAVTDPCYDKHGDWLFDKSQVMLPQAPDVEAVYDKNYAKKEK